MKDTVVGGRILLKLVMENLVVKMGTDLKGLAPCFTGTVVTK